MTSSINKQEVSSIKTDESTNRDNTNKKYSEVTEPKVKKKVQFNNKVEIIEIESYKNYNKDLSNALEVRKRLSQPKFNCYCQCLIF